MSAAVRPRRRAVPADALVGAALLALAAAAAVLVFGVIVTSGVYGSRMAWLLGVVLPLLAVSMLLSRLAQRFSDPPRQAARGAPSMRRRRISRVIFVSAAVAFGVPLALAAMLVIVDGLLIAVAGIAVLL